jgi:hypothetical protein
MEEEFIIQTSGNNKPRAILASLKPEQQGLLSPAEDPGYIHPMRGRAIPIKRLGNNFSYGSFTPRSPLEYITPEQIIAYSPNFWVKIDHIGRLKSLVSGPEHEIKIETPQGISHFSYQGKARPSTVNPDVEWRTDQLRLSVEVSERESATIRYFAPDEEEILSIPDFEIQRVLGWGLKEKIDLDLTGKYKVPSLDFLVDKISEAEALASSLTPEEFFDRRAFPTENEYSLKYGRALIFARNLFSTYRSSLRDNGKLNGNEQIIELEKRVDKIPETYQRTWTQQLIKSLPAIIAEAQKDISLMIQERNPCGRVFTPYFPNKNQNQQIDFLISFGLSPEMPKDPAIVQEMARLYALNFQFNLDRNVNNRLEELTSRKTRAFREYQEAVRELRSKLPNLKEDECWKLKKH